MKKENIYDKTQPINKNLFECEFDFEELTKTEKDICRETLVRINEDVMEFDLLAFEKKIEPLEILLKLKNNKTTGEVRVKIHDKDHKILGFVIFRTLKFIEISNLIDFDSSVTTYPANGKSITVKFLCDDIFYTSDNKDFEKIT